MFHNYCVMFGLSSDEPLVHFEGAAILEDQSLSYVTFHNIWPSLMGRGNMIGFLSSMVLEAFT